MLLPLILAAALAKPIDLSKVSAEERLAATTVRVYGPNAQAPKPAQVLGDVEARSCSYSYDREASGEDAVHQLQLVAKRMGADAVEAATVQAGTNMTNVFDRCRNWVDVKGIAVTTAAAAPN